MLKKPLQQNRQVEQSGFVLSSDGMVPGGREVAVCLSDSNFGISANKGQVYYLPVLLEKCNAAPLPTGCTGFFRRMKNKALERSVQRFSETNNIMIYPSALINSRDVPYLLMGIVNVTPDSFFDGGKYHMVDSAVAHARKLAADGAHILDIGGASSRPGAKPVPEKEEIRRILPVVEEVAAFFDGPVSIDTTSSGVARAAIEAGASWVNDISAGRTDPEMVRLAAQAGCTVVLMHSRGTPESMQQKAQYGDVVEEVIRELTAAVKNYTDGGVAMRNVVIDPGIGFAKTAKDNLELLRGMERIVALGYPVLIGTSRKSFIGCLTGRDVEGRLAGTLASVAAAYKCGVCIFRVHDVAETGDFLKVLSELI